MSTAPHRAKSMRQKQLTGAHAVSLRDSGSRTCAGASPAQGAEAKPSGSCVCSRCRLRCGRPVPDLCCWCRVPPYPLSVESSCRCDGEPSRPVDQRVRPNPGSGNRRPTRNQRDPTNGDRVRGAGGRGSPPEIRAPPPFLPIESLQSPPALLFRAYRVAGHCGENAGQRTRAALQVQVGDQESGPLADRGRRQVRLED